MPFDGDFSLFTDIWFTYFNLRLLFTFIDSIPASFYEDQKYDDYISPGFLYRKAAGAEIIIKRPVLESTFLGIGYAYVFPGDTYVTIDDDDNKRNLMSKDGFSRIAVTLHLVY
jgi:hypothetical protein